MNKQGCIVRWDGERGFGFVRSPSTDADVFFHIRDFRGGRTSPTEGLAVSYEEIHVGGKGPRAMAVVPLQVDRSGRTSHHVGQRAGVRGRRAPPAAHAGTEILAMLLLVPLYAALLVWSAWTQRLPVPLVLAAPLLGVVTFYLYWHDKFAAQRGAWRTPEDTLHLASLLGGWHGAWLGQRLLRHKSSKASFRRVYWGSVALHWLMLVAWLATAVPAR